MERDLRPLARRYGLRISGSKADLTQRLLTHELGQGWWRDEERRGAAWELPPEKHEGGGVGDRMGMGDRGGMTRTVHAGVGSEGGTEGGSEGGSEGETAVYGGVVGDGDEDGFGDEEGGSDGGGNWGGGVDDGGGVGGGGGRVEGEVVSLAAVDVAVLNLVRCWGGERCRGGSGKLFGPNVCHHHPPSSPISSYYPPPLDHLSTTGQIQSLSSPPSPTAVVHQPAAPHLPPLPPLGPGGAAGTAGAHQGVQQTAIGQEMSG